MPALSDSKSDEQQRPLIAPILGKNTQMPHLSVFTHGDTILAHWSDNGEVTGGGADLIRCGLERAGISYDFQRAPLSRSTQLLDSGQNLLWFPSAHRDEDDRLMRSIGPIGRVRIYWHFRKDIKWHPRDAETFKENARVTAYTGSFFERRLKRQGYNYVESSADNNRIVTTLLEGKAEAALALDFTAFLTDRTKSLVDRYIARDLYSATEVSYIASRALYASHPEVILKLRETVNTCMVENSFELDR